MNNNNNNNCVGIVVNSVEVPISQKSAIIVHNDDNDNNNHRLPIGWLIILVIFIMSSLCTLAIMQFIMNTTNSSLTTKLFDDRQHHISTLTQIKGENIESKVATGRERTLPSSSAQVFNLFEDCSYERPLLNGATETVPISKSNLPRIKDLPFGFGCKVVKLPSITSIPFGTQHMNERNSDIFSPIKPGRVNIDICQKYSNVSCMDYFCYSNSSLGSVDPYKYEIFNYCKYCKNNREDFLQFQYKIYYREDAVVNETTSRNVECPAFATFPSAFYCGNIQTGLPLYFLDSFYIRLRNPFFCFCHTYSTFNSMCDSSLFTTAFDFAKIVVSILFSTSLALGALITYVIPQIRQVSRVRKIGILNTCSILTILAASSSVVISSVMYAVAYLGESENTTLSNMALSFNVFFTYYSMLPVMLTFDRIYNYLYTGEKRNCPKFKIMILMAFILLTINAVYVTTSYILEFSKIGLTIATIVVAIGYIAFAIPWIDNLMLFFVLSYRLRKALRNKTNVPFFKTKYFYQFCALNTLSGIALFSCLSAFLARQFGSDSTTYQFSYYIEQVSLFANYSTLLIMLVILYDSQLFTDCYRPILQLFKLFDSRRNNNQLKDSLLSSEETNEETNYNNSIPVSYPPTNSTTNSDQTYRKDSSYYVPPTPTSFVSELSSNNVTIN
ncbi:predicted protein [Naegleria gruberi]|uniref:Predicted protein n=1 Tax=Naegleria gruberi TaxID=5762 RepID=D2VFC2_NAEGR|nr:uncharacterized protein NAEGRDRAFT_67575 [Naegleria gruberi]EFC44434.1 predicted protein [Naegleria gruberi]|eukprot:XP_002677178.1 predicted protein [Naegleria gruberi strain NEG-M]